MKSEQIPWELGSQWALNDFSVNQNHYWKMYNRMNEFEVSLNELQKNRYVIAKIMVWFF